MKKKGITIITLLLIIYLMNYTLLPIFIGLKPIIHVYKYEIAPSELILREIPEKGKTYTGMIKEFEQYKIEKSIPNSELCRCFKTNWLKFWYWHDYINHERWNLPVCNNR